MHRLFICIYLLILPIVSIALESNPIVFTQAEFVNEYTTRIPFKKIDQLFVVEAELYGKSGNFIIDTGSEKLLLNSKHFSNRFHYQSPSNTFGVHGQIDQAIPNTVGEFLLQDIILKNTNSDIIDLSHIEKTKKMNLLGIIGFNILKDFEVFIDLHLNQITLSRIDKKGNRLDGQQYLEKITDTVPFRLHRHTIILDTYLNNAKYKMGLDTGAEYNQLNKKIYRKLKPLFQVDGKSVSLKDAGGKEQKVTSGKLYRLKLSNNSYFGPMRTMVANLREMEAAFGTRLDGILGYELFKQKRTIINYKKRKLYFVKTPMPRH